MYSGKIFLSLTASHNCLRNSKSLSFSFSLCLDSRSRWALISSSINILCALIHFSCCLCWEYNNRVVIILVAETLNKTATYSSNSTRPSSALINKPYKMIATREIITIVNTIIRQSFLFRFLFEFIFLFRLWCKDKRNPCRFRAEVIGDFYVIILFCFHTCFQKLGPVFYNYLADNLILDRILIEVFHKMLLQCCQ